MTSKMLYGDVDEEKRTSLKSVESFRMLKTKISVKRK